tara:strand:- start:696 stop:1208 length:513 start_codon:yes stop_codon:yes gene_type:complete
MGDDDAHREKKDERGGIDHDLVLERFSKFTLKNRCFLKLEDGTCIECFKDITFGDVGEWVDNSETATCPACFSDKIMPKSKLKELVSECNVKEKKILRYLRKKCIPFLEAEPAEKESDSYDSDWDDNFDQAINVFKNRSTAKTSKKQGRNEPCACGSGKKFKKCLCFSCC